MKEDVDVTEVNITIKGWHLNKHLGGCTWTLKSTNDNGDKVVWEAVDDINISFFKSAVS